MKFVGVLALSESDLVSFRRTDVFEADDDEQAYDILHELMDGCMPDSEQSHVLNDWVINLDDPSQATILPQK